MKKGEKSNSIKLQWSWATPLVGPISYGGRAEDYSYSGVRHRFVLGALASIFRVPLVEPWMLQKTLNT